MSIINRRNAVLGWGAWKIGKRLGKSKIRKATPAAGLVLVGGALAGGYVAARRFGYA